MVRMPHTPVEAVQTLVRLAYRARRDGVESLREEAEHADNEMLRDGLHMVIEGRDETEMKAELGRQITEAKGRLIGDDTVMRMVEAGLLSIHAGDEPKIVREKLEAMLTPEEQAQLAAQRR